MTVGVPERDPARQPPQHARTPASGGPVVATRQRVVESGWWPAGLLYLLTAVALRYYGVPVSTTLIFTVYVVAGIALPGVLLWRAAQRRSRTLAADLGPGLAIGYAVEVLAYLPARAAGAPRLELLAPLVVVATFVTVPRLRRYWRPAAAGRPSRPPALWSWSMAGLAGMVAWWSFARVFRFHGLTWPYNASPDADMPFHLAILGEVKHHVPPRIPFVTGEPLHYHWFVYAEIASTSWTTGIEMQTLLYRLSLLPMLAGLVLMVATLARRLTGVWWTGPVAVLITFFTLAPDPYRWPLPPFFADSFGAVDDASLLRPVLWSSPTQTFGAVLFAAAVLLLMDLIDGGRGRRRWALFAMLLVGVMGAKATYLPLLLAALLLVVAVRLVRRRPHRAALIASGLTLACLIYAQVVLFGGATQGLRFDPLSTMRVWAMSTATGFAAGPHAPLWRSLLVSALFAACWVAIWAGAAGLSRRLLEPRLLLLAGIGTGGVAAIVLMGHSGLSQGFFFQSARPYLSVLAAAGLAALVPRPTRRVGTALGAAVLLGAGLVLAVRSVGDGHVPSMSTGARNVAAQLVWPYALLIVLVAAVGAALLAVRRRVPPALSGALVVALLLGGGLLTGYDRLAAATRAAAADGWRSAEIVPTSITQGAQEAGRWLRDHSNPDDIVATNAHCQAPRPAACGNQHAWVSGYTERRVLVEGWAFTNTVHAKAIEAGINDDDVPYWRPDLLADNDAAFTAPSARTVGRLRDRYRVRWMFVDERQGTPPAALQRFATLRYRAGRCAVFEIKP